MDILLVPFFNLLRILLSVYGWIVLTGLIVHQLIVFRIVNPYQTLVQNISSAYYVLTEPILKRLRGIFPMVGYFDITPIVLLLFVYFFEHLIVRVLMRFA